MKETVFKISKMDCPSEEGLIRLSLEFIPSIKKLSFDLGSRTMTAYHDGDVTELLSKLEPLKLDSRAVSTKELDEVEALVKSTSDHDITQKERLALKWVFAINAVMFLVEFIAGIMAQSTGLLADSLDMFADAAVFALSLYAVGKAVHQKKFAARLSGYFQMILAFGAFIQVLHHFIYGSEPEGPIMIIVAGIALVANAVCMRILFKHREGEVHMQASWIFLSNDVIANALVVIAGISVMFLKSPIPDLVAGIIIGVVVFWGSIRILRAAKE